MEGRLSAQKNVVWILGSGFSQSLGGPMLNALLAPRELEVVSNQTEILDKGIDPAEKVRREEIIKDMDIARQIFATGKKQELWSHAEDFLDTLETANLLEDGEPNQGHSAGYAQINRLLNVGRYELKIKDLTKAARHAIAFDCSVFLRAADVNSEKWEPYRAWDLSLHGSHSVVTFNYDCVPDLLAECKDSHLCIVDPENDRLQTTLSTAEQTNHACVLKVHGSLGWGRDGNRIFKAKLRDGTPNSDASLLWKKNDEFAIGVPGPAKKDLVGQALNHLWDKAMQRIGSADIVVFVGYRFPPSDSMARQGILKALHNNSKENLRTITVLGPNNPDEPRLVHLLETAMNSSNSNRFVVPKPLYAQDFLSLLSMVDIESDTWFS
jgi:hypothetical protein